MSHAPAQAPGALVRAGAFVLLSVIPAFTAVRSPAAETDWDVAPDTWVATDALGRPLPSHEEVGGPRPDRYVGVFYWTWHQQWHHPAHPDGILPANNDEFLAEDMLDRGNWSGPQCYWAEPEDGYYLSTDSWVLRKHALMLANADVDVIFFDTTNDSLYLDTVEVLVDVYRDIRSRGGRTPAIAFFADAGHAPTLYRDLYSRGRYQDLWFLWKGRPLLLWENREHEQELTAEIREFFTLRHCWAWTDGRETWSWVHRWPQGYGWLEDADLPEQVSVSMASHPAFNIGRSFINGRQPPYDPKTLTPGTQHLGIQFRQQWDEALLLDPEFVFVTGWNEWIAAHYGVDTPKPFLGVTVRPGDYFHVDGLNTEYSRDAEPMRGGFGDNYYYQMWANIRRYKGVRRPAHASRAARVTIDGAFEDWQDTGLTFRDHRGDAVTRSHPGVHGSIRYENRTGRHDFTRLQAAHDAEHVFFLAETAGAITAPAPDDRHWMNLFLNTDGDGTTGWEGFDVVVNRDPGADGTTSVRRFAGSCAERRWWSVSELRTAVPSPPHLHGANWIWLEAPAEQEPPDTIRFRKRLELAAGVTAVHVLVTAHRNWSLTVGGRELCSGTDALTPVFMPIPLEAARGGTLDLEIACEADPRPVFPWNDTRNGLIAKLRVEDSEGVRTVVTDDTWEAVAVAAGEVPPAPPSDHAWQRVTTVMPFGVQPWGTLKRALPLAVVPAGAAAPGVVCELGRTCLVDELLTRFLVTDSSAVDGAAYALPLGWKVQARTEGDTWADVRDVREIPRYRFATQRQVRFAPVATDALRLLPDVSGEAGVAISEVRVAGREIGPEGPPRWEPVGTARYAVSGNRMELAVSRRLLNLTTPLTLDFHWADNLQYEWDITEFSVSGDSAPDRRAAYRYRTEPVPETTRTVTRRIRRRVSIGGGPQHPESFAAENTLGQSFVTPGARLVAIQMSTPTWGRFHPDHGLRVQIRETGPDGALVYERLCPAEAIMDGLLRLEQGLEALEPETRYYLRAAPEVPIQTERLGWWSTQEDVYPHGQAFRNDQPVSGDRSMVIEYFR